MQHRLATIGLAVALIAGSGLVAVAEPVLVKRMAQAHKGVTKDRYRLSDGDRIYCGQRSFSISVGNPAFKDRVALWPAPCGW
jgi:hypothetical protein